MSVDLRNPTIADLQRFAECLAADPDHAGQDPLLWAEAPGEMLVFFDKEGNRIWVRIEKVLRVHIQHDHESPRKALIGILFKGFSWLQSSARIKGFTEVVFESRAPRLIQLLRKCFGFEPVKENYYVRTLASTEKPVGRTREFLQRIN